MEASGSASALRQGFHLTRAGGTIVQVGIPPSEERIPLGLILFKELNYLGSFRFCNVYEEVLAICASKDVKPEDLISHTFPFMELNKAIQYAGGDDNVLKIQVRV